MTTTPGFKEAYGQLSKTAGTAWDAIPISAARACRAFFPPAVQRNVEGANPPSPSARCSPRGAIEA